MLTSLLFVNQVTAQNTARVEVIKFNWSMYDRKQETENSSLLSTGIFNRPDSNNRTGEKTVEERSWDLTKIERAAVREASAPSGNIFVYELKVKNLDGKAIKSFIWEYQAAKQTAPQNVFSRQFVCVEKIKPGDSKKLRIVSHLPPLNVVSAAAAHDKSERSYAVDIVINRVEYDDGTVWQRSGWVDSKLAPNAPEIAEILKNNDCAVL